MKQQMHWLRIQIRVDQFVFSPKNMTESVNFIMNVNVEITFYNNPHLFQLLNSLLIIVLQNSISATPAKSDNLKLSPTRFHKEHHDHVTDNKNCEISHFHIMHPVTKIREPLVYHFILSCITLSK